MPVKKQSAVVQTAGVPPKTGRTSRPASSSRVNSRNADSPMAVMNSGRPWTRSRADTLEIDGAEMGEAASEAASCVQVLMRGDGTGRAKNARGYEGPVPSGT